MNQREEPIVPFNDLGRGTASLRNEIDTAIARVLNSGWYVMGPEHDAFESELADYIGVSQAVLVGNGTDALQLALASLGTTSGDHVITAANAGGYTSTAARSVGAIPVYAEVDPASHLVSAATLEAAYLSADGKPRVAVVTHLFGAAADMKNIMAWARSRNVAIVEDCAQSIGATIAGRKAGSFGDVATTSFYPTKNLGALGDGGAVFTSNSDLAMRLRQLRQYGWGSKYLTTVAGGQNSRLDEMQAAILRVKLPHLDAGNHRRREIHHQYEVAAAGRGLRLVNTVSESFVGHLAVVEVDDRATVRTAFDDAGIKTDVHYPVPDHKQPLLANTAQPELPVTEFLANRVLSLPLFPELEQREIDRIAAVVGRV